MDNFTIKEHDGPHSQKWFRSLVTPKQQSSSYSCDALCSCNHCWLFFSYELIILIHWRLADIRFLLPYTIRKGQCSINWAHRLLFLHSRTGMTCTNFQSIGLVFVEEIFFVLFKFIENIKLWDAVESELFRNLNVVPLWYGNL